VAERLLPFLSMSRDQHLWCYDGDHEQFVKFDLRGHIETVFGRYGVYPGATWGVHQISADSEGNLYAAEVFGGRTQKFVPKRNANPHDLFFGRELAPRTPTPRISTVRMASPTAGGDGKAESERADSKLCGNVEFRQVEESDGGERRHGKWRRRATDLDDGDAERQPDFHHHAIRG
jgi:hypothetical protein